MKIALASSSSESSARDEWRYDYSEREREREGKTGILLRIRISLISGSVCASLRAALPADGFKIRKCMVARSRSVAA